MSFHKRIEYNGKPLGIVRVRRSFDVNRIMVTDAGVEIGQDYRFVVKPIKNNGWELGAVTPSGYISLAQYYDRGYIEVNGDYKVRQRTLYFSSHKTNVEFKGRAKRGKLSGDLKITSRAFPGIEARIEFEHPEYVPAPKVKRYV